MKHKQPEIDVVGTKRWYNDKNQLHRLDGPAYISEYLKAWWKNGERHRTDGPAKMWTIGTEEWYINGVEVEPIPDIICLLRKKLDEV